MGRQKATRRGNPRRSRRSPSCERSISIGPWNLVVVRVAVRAAPARRRYRRGDAAAVARDLRGVKHQHFAQMPEQLLFLVWLAQIYLDTQFLGAIAVLLGRARRDHATGYVC